MIAGLRRLGTAILVGLERRLPALTRLKAPEPLPVTLGMRRIYVLPTRFGLFLGLVLFGMLLTGLNYDNAPALLLTFFAGAYAFNAQFATVRNLHGLAVRGIEARPVFAGETLELAVRVAETAGRPRTALRLRHGSSEAMFSLAAGEERRVSLSIATERRGRLPLGQLRLSSVAPYGLFVCWSHLHPPGELIVYPRPERDGPPPPFGGFRARPLAAVSGEEPQGVRSWRPGEPVRRIAWRASARMDTLLSKEFAVWKGGEITLRYRELAGLDHEARIARLARWVLLSERAGLRYALELPGATIRLGRGPAQLDRCLRALALLP